MMSGLDNPWGWPAGQPRLGSSTELNWMVFDWSPGLPERAWRTAHRLSFDQVLLMKPQVSTTDLWRHNFLAQTTHDKLRRGHCKPDWGLGSCITASDFRLHFSEQGLNESVEMQTGFFIAIRLVTFSFTPWNWARELQAQDLARRSSQRSAI